MSIELHGGRYIEDDDEGEGGRIKSLFGKGWSKSGDKGMDSEIDAEARTMERELKPRNRYLPILLTIVALNAFATVIWYAYNWGRGSLDSSALPVISSDSDPIKVRPADEGGLDIPHQDKLILNSGVAGGESEVVEHLLPLPEEPMVLDLSSAKEQGGDIPALGHQLQPSKPNPEVSVIEVESTEPLLPPVDTQDAIGQEILELAEAPAAPADPEPAVTATPTPTPKPAITQSAQVPTDSGYLLQLAAVQDLAITQSEWARMQKSFPDLLGGMELIVQEAVVGGKTYHRILTGPYPTKATVEDICNQLKSKNQPCLVKKQAP